MVIGIYAGCSFHFGFWDENTTCLGGSETWANAISIELSKLGHKVIIFGNPQYEHLSSNGVYYSSFENYDNYIATHSFDIFISSRTVESIVPSLNAIKIYIMAHMREIHDLIPNDSRLNRINGIFTLSEYQENYLKSEYNVHTKFIRTCNGCDASLYKEICTDKINAMVWSTTPNRGFEDFYYSAFQEIIKVVPDFKIYLCSYSDEDKVERFSSLKGVEVLGKLSKEELAQLQGKCKIWLMFNNGYFKDWITGEYTENHETFCITAIENALAHNAIVAFNAGGIATTLKGYSGLCNNINDFTNLAIKILTDNDSYIKLSNEANNLVQKYTWINAAKVMNNEFHKDEKILFGIINYNCDNNAIRWYNLFKDSPLICPIIIDTYHKENGGTLPNNVKIEYLPNIYWGGAINYITNLSKDNTWMMYVVSDVEITDADANSLKEYIYEVIHNDNIAGYSPSLRKDSSGFGHGNGIIDDGNHWVFNKGTNDIRSILIPEDYFFLTRTKLCEKVLSIWNKEVKYGWGISDSIANLAIVNGFKIVIDDRVEVYNNQGTGYDRDGATDEMYQMSEKTTEYIMSNYDAYKFPCYNRTRCYHKDTTDSGKYIIFVCAKNEDEYIIEWINYYLNLGFDKVIIADNNDSDTLENILQEYINNNTVELFNCHGLKAWQNIYYSVFCEEGNYQWCAYFDVDEFLALTAPYTNIKDYLATINEDCICFNWMMYGSNGILKKEEGGVLERFNTPILNSESYLFNCFIKSIARGGKGRFAGCTFMGGSHLPTSPNKVTYNVGGYFKPDYNEYHHFPPRYKNGFIKHFYTKSFMEWINKANRGWPEGTKSLKTQNYFAFSDIQDNSPLKRIMISPFNGEINLEETKSSWGKIIDDYDVIQLTNSSKNLHSFLLGVLPLMAITNNHTFILTDEHIDDVTFSIILEQSLLTNNKLIFLNNKDDIWNTYMRFTKKSISAYYIIDFT